MDDQDRLTQSAHAQELKVVRILSKTLGISRSEARLRFRLSEAQRNYHPIQAAPAAQLFNDAPAQIKRSEVVVDSPTPIVRQAQADPILAPMQPVGDFGLAFPADEGKYDLNIDSDGVATWAFDTVPNAPLMVDGEYTLTVDTGFVAWTPRKLPPDIPDAIPGEDHYYVLRRNSSDTPEWFDLTQYEIPDCSGSELVYHKVFGFPVV